MNRSPAPASPPAAVALPLEVVDRGAAGAAVGDGNGAGPDTPARPRLRVASLVALAVAIAVAAVAWVGTAGRSAPASAPGVAAQGDPAGPRVVALGRLLPRGELRTLAPPFGAGDAVVAEIRVQEGQQVPAGAVLAVFDSAPALEAALAVAERQLASRQAALAQAERDVSSSQAESDATLARANVVARAADMEYRRWAALVDQGFVSPAALDQHRARRDEAAEEQRRARAALARHAGHGSEQPDLQVVRRAVDAAMAERERAVADLARTRLRAPADGTVITIHVQPGERPGSAGVLDFGDTRVMTAELELYQADVVRVAAGQRVTLRSPALADPLAGRISRIGMSVGRQQLTDTSPAAQIDARVVRATVDLDEASSARARRLVGLEVQADIETGSP